MSPTHTFRAALLVLIVNTFIAGQAASLHASDGAIEPSTDHPWYWEHNGRPVVLIGGSDDHNLFQWTGDRLTDHLDLLVTVGGNYVRNTMSDREAGNVFAFRQVEDGRYDLDQWNPEYWDRLTFFLDQTSRRGIIVQLTLWDRFDIAGGRWDIHPWNPENNVNLEPGAWSSMDDFFTTVDRDDQHGLRYQRQFVDKVLSITLQYGNVLYNIANESTHGAQWEDHWAAHLHRVAEQQGTRVYVTTMQFDPASSVRHVMSKRGLYAYVEISQNNQDSRGGRGPGHWDNLMDWRRKIASQAGGPIPMNNEKIYGSGAGENYSAGTETEAVNRFWRNIFAGCASSRFHRPALPGRWGAGLNERVQTNLEAMTMLLAKLDLFTCSPHNDLLRHRVDVPTTMEAYVTANIGRQYAVYFPPGRHTVDLDPWIFLPRLQLRWLDIDQLAWSEPEILEVEWEGDPHDWGMRGRIRLTTPSNRPYVALLEAIDDDQVP